MKHRLSEDFTETTIRFFEMANVLMATNGFVLLEKIEARSGGFARRYKKNGNSVYLSASNRDIEQPNTEMLARVAFARVRNAVRTYNNGCTQGEAH